MFRSLRLARHLSGLKSDVTKHLGPVEDLIQPGDTRAFDALVLLLREPDVGVKCRVIAALGKLRDARGIQHLRPLVLHINEQVAWAACRSLTTLGQPDWEKCYRSPRWTGHGGGLVTGTGTPDIGEMCKRRTIHGVDMLDFFVAALTDDRCYHNYAAQGLGGLGDERGVAPLIAFIERAIERKEYTWPEKHDYVYAEVEALSKFGDPRAVAPIIRVLSTVGKKNKPGSTHSDTRAFDRACAAQCLGRMGDVRAVEPLLTALDDEDDGVRKSASEALGKLGDMRAVEPLIKTVMTGRVGEPAIIALGILRDPRAFAALAQIARTGGKTLNSGWCRALAMRALLSIPDPKVPDVLASFAMDGSTPPNIRRDAASLLKQMGDPRGY